MYKHTKHDGRKNYDNINGGFPKYGDNRDGKYNGPNDGPKQI